jgi:glycosyltransferase involved in cell wall biosynthesis
MNDSKFDDFPRHLLAELAKPVMMLPYHAALVAGARHADYLRFLGFRKRPVLQGYDTVSVDRLRNQVQADVAMPVPHEDRAFLFVGRFVPKKNIALLIEGYRRYVDLAGGARHPLILIGAGPLEAEIRAQISEAGLDEHILFPGFLSAPDVAATLAKGLALILPSREEQWGLVVNEALAMHLPVIVSENVGARDALVRNLVNGFVIEPDSAEGLSRAMHILSSSPETWQGMARESATLAPRGDTGRFVEAVAALLSTL